jgi:hypothetical protein
MEGQYSALIHGPVLRKKPSSRKVDKCGTVFGERVRGLGNLGERQGKALGEIQREAPVGIDMLIEQGR